MVARYCLLGTAGHMTIVTIETFMNSINPDDPRPLSDPGVNRAESTLFLVIYDLFSRNLREDMENTTRLY